MQLAESLVPVRQAFGETPKVLTEALQDGVNLAVWQRRLPAHIEDFARLLLSLGEPLADARTLEIGKDGEVPTLDGVASAYADLAGYEGFVADLRWLVGAYACLLDARSVGLRLRVLDGAMCPRFHVDHVSLRLITTYAGPASEWLEEGVINRRRLAQEEVDAAHVRHLACGDVALLKGEKWLGNEGAGLVHRSPSPGNGERRLILTLDWLA
ncbi:DUF1826 domain-containing protein [Pseudomonas putida CSV86]|uniref:DUF1826 domain-containing protein n=1 Tax=Pseudomonas bharatica CSV86 TaxID=1005395 RepID=L1LY25_9PSED|nr:DUF1826 domain-containing protein [Pseudomonas bharatica]NNJ18302.1 DUF1826 domain-containing protein [Pseudomonas bharatica CSV86]